MYDKLAAAATPAVYLTGGTAVVAGMGVQDVAAILGGSAAILTAIANFFFRYRQEKRDLKYHKHEHETLIRERLMAEHVMDASEHVLEEILDECVPGKDRK